MDVKTFLGRIKRAQAEMRGATRTQINSYFIREMAGQAQLNAETAGRWSGQAWDFSVEPVYGSRVRWTPLYPLIERFGTGWKGDSTGRIIHRIEGIDLPRLTQTGGIGPYGEPFPARNAYYLTPPQRNELIKLLGGVLIQTLAKHLPLRRRR